VSGRRMARQRRRNIMVRLLLYAILIYAAAKAFLKVRSYLKSLPHRRKVEVPHDVPAASDMVRDPVCGVYITSEESLTTTVNGREFHFCSAECRRKFIEDQG
jgi:YHS domain-containing protein